MSRRKQARPRHLDDEMDTGPSAAEADNGKKILLLIIFILNKIFFLYIYISEMLFLF